MSDRFLKYLTFSLIFFSYFLFLFHKIDLSTADLGRHIINGKVILETKQIPTTNYYSYTEANFPTLNHHWLSGVIFYLIYSFAGFSGLSVFFIVVSLLTLVLFVLSVRSVLSEKFVSSWLLVSLVSLLALPLLAQRTEIRPEMFSYLFCGVFLYVLISKLFPCHSRAGGNLYNSHLHTTHCAPYTVLLLILQILWINLHIYFFLGPFLVGLFSLSNLISTRFKSWRFNLSLISLITLISLINPYGFRGLLAPLTIFTNYGYRLAENQSVLFLQNLFPNFIYPYFLVMLALLTISCLFCVFLSRFCALCDPPSHPEPLPNKKLSELPNYSIIILVSLMAFFSVRNFTLFGFFFIYLISVNSLSIRIIRDLLSKDITKISLITLISLISLIVLAFTPQKYFPYWRGYGLGLEKDNLTSIDFFKTNNLPGPIFNNYDIGGYLIYGLYPKEKVYVDNRPEAYSVDFFQKTYVPMQENDTVWQEKLKLYNFQTIFFAWHDMTPWGQTFLKFRLEDPSWAPIYIDQYALILLRNTEANQKIIDQFLVPKDTFSFR